MKTTSSPTISVEVPTNDNRFPEGRDGRRIVQGVEASRTLVKATGCTMVTFTMTATPSDYPSSVGFAPVQWIV